MDEKILLQSCRNRCLSCYLQFMPHMKKYYTSISSCLKASIDGSRILKMHIGQIRFSVICILMCCCKSCIMTSSRRPVIIMMDQTAELVLDAIIVSQMLLMCPEFLIHNGWWGEKTHHSKVAKCLSSSTITEQSEK